MADAYMKSGKLLLVDGKLAASENCCCNVEKTCYIDYECSDCGDACSRYNKPSVTLAYRRKGDRQDSTVTVGEGGASVDIGKYLVKKFEIQDSGNDDYYTASLYKKSATAGSDPGECRYQVNVTRKYVAIGIDYYVDLSNCEGCPPAASSIPQTINAKVGDSMSGYVHGFEYCFRLSLDTEYHDPNTVHYHGCHVMCAWWFANHGGLRKFNVCLGTSGLLGRCDDAVIVLTGHSSESCYCSPPTHHGTGGHRPSNPTVTVSLEQGCMFRGEEVYSKYLVTMPCACEPRSVYLVDKEDSNDQAIDTSGIPTYYGSATFRIPLGSAVCDPVVSCADPVNEHVWWNLRRSDSAKNCYSVSSPPQDYDRSIAIVSHEPVLFRDAESPSLTLMLEPDCPDSPFSAIYGTIDGGNVEFRFSGDESSPPPWPYSCFLDHDHGTDDEYVCGGVAPDIDIYVESAKGLSGDVYSRQDLMSMGYDLENIAVTCPEGGDGCVATLRRIASPEDMYTVVLTFYTNATSIPDSLLVARLVLEDGTVLAEVVPGSTTKILCYGCDYLADNIDVSSSRVFIRGDDDPSHSWVFNRVGITEFDEVQDFQPDPYWFGGVRYVDENEVCHIVISPMIVTFYRVHVPLSEDCDRRVFVGLKVNDRRVSSGRFRTLKRDKTESYTQGEFVDQEGVLYICTSSGDGETAAFEEVAPYLYVSYKVGYSTYVDFPVFLMSDYGVWESNVVLLGSVGFTLSLEGVVVDDWEHLTYEYKLTRPKNTISANPMLGKGDSAKLVTKDVCSDTSNDAPVPLGGSNSPGGQNAGRGAGGNPAQAGAGGGRPGGPMPGGGGGGGPMPGGGGGGGGPIPKFPRFGGFQFLGWRSNDSDPSEHEFGTDGSGWPLSMPPVYANGGSPYYEMEGTWACEVKASVKIVCPVAPMALERLPKTIYAVAEDLVEFDGTVGSFKDVDHIALKLSDEGSSYEGIGLVKRPSWVLDFGTEPLEDPIEHGMTMTIEPQCNEESLEPVFDFKYLLFYGPDRRFPLYYYGDGRFELNAKVSTLVSVLDVVFHPRFYGRHSETADTNLIGLGHSAPFDRNFDKEDADTEIDAVSLRPTNWGSGFGQQVSMSTTVQSEDPDNPYYSPESAASICISGLEEELRGHLDYISDPANYGNPDFSIRYARAAQLRIIIRDLGAQLDEYAQYKEEHPELYSVEAVLVNSRHFAYPSSSDLVRRSILAGSPMSGDIGVSVVVTGYSPDKIVISDEDKEDIAKKRLKDAADRLRAEALEALEAGEIEEYSRLMLEVEQLEEARRTYTLPDIEKDREKMRNERRFYAVFDSSESGWSDPIPESEFYYPSLVRSAHHPSADQNLDDDIPPGSGERLVSSVLSLYRAMSDEDPHSSEYARFSRIKDTYMSYTTESDYDGFLEGLDRAMEELPPLNERTPEEQRRYEELEREKEDVISAFRGHSFDGEAPFDRTVSTRLGYPDDVEWLDDNIGLAGFHDDGLTTVSFALDTGDDGDDGDGDDSSESTDCEYREVTDFVPGGTYGVGDMVSFGGIVWRCVVRGMYRSISSGCFEMVGSAPSDPIDPEEHDERRDSPILVFDSDGEAKSFSKGTLVLHDGVVWECSVDCDTYVFSPEYFRPVGAAESYESVVKRSYGRYPAVPPPFSTTISYAFGDVVSYEGYAWECVEPGEFEEFSPSAFRLVGMLDEEEDKCLDPVLHVFTGAYNWFPCRHGLIDINRTPHSGVSDHIADLTRPQPAPVAAAAGAAGDGDSEGDGEDKEYGISDAPVRISEPGSPDPGYELSSVVVIGGDALRDVMRSVGSIIGSISPSDLLWYRTDAFSSFEGQGSDGSSSDESSSKEPVSSSVPSILPHECMALLYSWSPIEFSISYEYRSDGPAVDQQAFESWASSQPSSYTADDFVSYGNDHIIPTGIHGIRLSDPPLPSPPAGARWKFVLYDVLQDGSHGYPICDDRNGIPPSVRGDLLVVVEYSEKQYSLSLSAYGMYTLGTPTGYNGGDSLLLPEPEPVCELGPRFLGWYLDSSFTLPISSISPDMRGDIVLYAKMEPARYLVDHIYRRMPGVVPEVDVVTVEEEGEYGSMTSVSPVFDQGHPQSMYVVEAVNNVPIQCTGSKASVVYVETSYTVTWSATPLQGGYWVGHSSDTVYQYYGVGDTLTVPESPPMNREGKAFLGWDPVPSAGSVVDGPMSFSAVWDDTVSVYFMDGSSLVYSLHGVAKGSRLSSIPDFSMQDPSSRVLHDGEVVPESDPVMIAVFAGWSYSASGDPSMDSSMLLVGDSDLTLYAVYREVRAVFSFDGRYYSGYSGDLVSRMREYLDAADAVYPFIDGSVIGRLEEGGTEYSIGGRTAFLPWRRDSGRITLYRQAYDRYRTDGGASWGDTPYGERVPLVDEFTGFVIRVEDDGRAYLSLLRKGDGFHDIGEIDDFGTEPGGSLVRPIYDEWTGSTVVDARSYFGSSLPIPPVQTVGADPVTGEEGMPEWASSLVSRGVISLKNSVSARGSDTDVFRDLDEETAFRPYLFDATSGTLHYIPDTEDTRTYIPPGPLNSLSIYNWFYLSIYTTDSPSYHISFTSSENGFPNGVGTDVPGSVFPDSFDIRCSYFSSSATVSYSWSTTPELHFSLESSPEPVRMRHLEDMRPRLHMLCDLYVDSVSDGCMEIGFPMTLDMDGHWIGSRGLSSTASGTADNLSCAMAIRSDGVKIVNGSISSSGVAAMILDAGASGRLVLENVGVSGSSSSVSVVSGILDASYCVFAGDSSLSTINSCRMVARDVNYFSVRNPMFENEYEYIQKQTTMEGYRGMIGVVPRSKAVYMYSGTMNNQFLDMEFFVDFPTMAKEYEEYIRSSSHRTMHVPASMYSTEYLHDQYPQILTWGTQGYLLYYTALAW